MNYLADLQSTLARLDAAPLTAFVRGCPGTLWLAGNGGSAATAQHWACDLSKAAGRRAQALGANAAVLTAWANDASYAEAYAHELAALARPGDRLLCLSCSGTSPNIVGALRQGAFLGLDLAIVTADGWACPIAAEVLAVGVPHAHYGILEDCFMALGHAVTEALCR